MNNKTLLKILSVFLCLCLVLGVAGCKPKNTNNSSSDLSSGDGNTADDNTNDGTDENTDEDTDDTTDEDSDENTEEDGDSDYEDDTDYSKDDTDEDSDDEDSDDGSDDMDVTENSFKLLNGSAPILTNYRGPFAAVYHGSVYMHDAYGRDYTDEMAEIEINRFIDEGYKNARTYWRSQWFWDKKTNRYNFDPNTNDKYKQFIRWAKKLQASNVTITLTTGWHLTSFLSNKENGIDETRYIKGPNIKWDDGWTLDNIYGELDGFEKNFPNLSYDDAFQVKYGLRLGTFAAMSIQELKKQGVNNVAYVLPFVEPSYWTFGSPLYEGPDAKILLNVMLGYNYAFRHGSYSSAAKDVKIVGPNQGTVLYGHGLLEYFYKYKQQTGKQLYDVMTSHYYFRRTEEMDDTQFNFSNDVYNEYDLVNDLYRTDPNTQEFWQDESGCGSFSVGKAEDDYTQVSSWNALCDATQYVAGMQHRVNGFMNWNAFDQLWIDDMTKSIQFDFGIHRTGICPSLFTSSIPYTQYYGVGLAVKYLANSGGGKTFKVEYDTAAGGYFGAMEHKDGNYTLIFINMLPASEMKIDLKMDKSINKTLYRHLFDGYEPKKSPAAKLADPDRVFKNVGDKLTDTIPPASLVVYSSIKK